jgi:CBS domain-containing protein
MYESNPREVQDVMTRKVAVLHEEENLELAEWGMKTFRFRHLPVVDGEKLVGLVSERDILRASISSLDEAHDLRDDNLKRYFFVREIMTTDVISVRPETSLIEAAAIMSINKLDCLPVTRADGMLVGIVTASDFLGVAIDLLRRIGPKPAQREAPARRESAQTR